MAELELEPVCGQQTLNIKTLSVKLHCLSLRGNRSISIFNLSGPVTPGCDLCPFLSISLRGVCPQCGGWQSSVFSPSLSGSWRYRKGRLDSGLFPHLRTRTEIPQQEKLGRGRQVPLAFSRSMVPPTRKWCASHSSEREKLGCRETCLRGRGTRTASSSFSHTWAMVLQCSLYSVIEHLLSGAFTLTPSPWYSQENWDLGSWSD